MVVRRGTQYAIRICGGRHKCGVAASMCTQVQRSTPGWPAGFAHVKHPPVSAPASIARCLQAPSWPKYICWFIERVMEGPNAQNAQNAVYTRNKRGGNSDTSRTALAKGCPCCPSDGRGSNTRQTRIKHQAGCRHVHTITPFRIQERAIGYAFLYAYLSPLHRHFALHFCHRARG